RRPLSSTQKVLGPRYGPRTKEVSMSRKHLSHLVMIIALWLIPTLASSQTRPSAHPQAAPPIERLGSIGGGIRTAAVSGGFAYVSEGKGLAVLDLHNPAQPAR